MINLEKEISPFSRINNSFNKFLFDDYGALDGRLKIVVYALLFIFSNQFYFGRVEDHLYMYPEEFIKPVGILNLLPTGLSIQDYIAFIHSTESIFYICWIFAIIGFLGRAPYVIIGILAFTYLGIDKLTSTIAHDWYLPMYAMALLGFTIRNDKWSVDAFLERYIKYYPFPIKQNKTDLTGPVIKIILILSVFTMFSAGISKLINGGWYWFNGSTLSHYFVENNSKGELGNFLYQIVKSNLWLIKIMSVWTMIFEITSIFAIFFKRFRIFFVINAWLFHLGIYLLMKPIFFAQMSVYLLIIDWREVFQKIVSKTESVITELPISQYQGIWQQQFIKIFSVGLIVVLSCVAVFEIDAYPLSNFPMFSEAITSKQRGKLSIVNFNQIETIKKTSFDYYYTKKPHSYPFVLSSYFVIQRDSADGEWVQAGKLFKSFYKKNTWKLRMGQALSSDFVHSSESETLRFQYTEKMFIASARFMNQKMNLSYNYKLGFRLLDGSILPLAEYKERE